MKKALIVTFFFPPHPSVASVRLQGLARTLPARGWEPVVLTPPLPGDPDARTRVVQTEYEHVVGSLKKKTGLKSGEGIERQVPGWSRAAVKFSVRLLGEVLVYPDYESGWHPHAVKAGKELLQRERFDAIVSSSPPGTAHLIARDLKDASGLPWAADLRDLWTQNYHYPWSPLRQSIERRLELKTLAAADALVTVSDPLVEQLRRIHRNRRIVSIPNGFDPEEAGTAELTRTFTITYTGTLYRGKQDPAPLFAALQNLIARGLVSADDLEVRFYGKVEDPAELEEKINRHGLKDRVQTLGLVPREQALQKQRESQVLLLLDWTDPAQPGVYTGKIFEYLAARRPVLSVGGSGGVVRDLLGDTRAGSHEPDPQEWLLRHYREFKRSGKAPYDGDAGRIDKYSHREMGRRFAELLDSLTK